MIDGVLLIYHRPVRWNDAATVMEHVSAFQRYSRFKVWPLNSELGVPSGLSGLRFRAVVLHYSVFNAGAYHLPAAMRRYLSEECDQSFKVAFFQDEHQYCRDRFDFLNEYGIDCVYSCLEEDQLERVYGARTAVPKLRSNLPGYVSDELAQLDATHVVSEAGRSVDIGYRGRFLAAYNGRGGREKFEIGRRFAELAEGRDLRLDIGCKESDRLYGDDWYRFVASCRAVLGVESGVSLIDLNDEVRIEYEALLAAGEQPTLERLEQGALGRVEGQIEYRTISPRHFEAAALGTCQILFEGRYSGAMEPMVHYIPLAKDFSNFEQVLDRFRDSELRARLTSNARRDLIDSGAYGYRAFIEGFDRTLIEAGLEPISEPSDARSVERAIYSRERLRAAGAYLRTVRARELPGTSLLRPLVRGARRVNARRRR